MSRSWIIRNSANGLASATFSECEAYRWSLTRRFTTKPDSQVRWLNMLMLNPSKADHEKDDPTITRQCVRAQLLGFGGFIATNAFGFRATDPRDMKKAADPIGPDNDYYIVREAQAALTCGGGGMVIAAWGKDGAHLGRSKQVLRLLADNGVKVHYLKLTKAGEPWHPLYLSYDIEPQLFEAAV